MCNEGHDIKRTDEDGRCLSNRTKACNIPVTSGLRGPEQAKSKYVAREFSRA
jgi:hypothetical protein